MAKTKYEIALNIINSITWDNWMNPDGTYMKVSEVLNNKIQFIRDKYFLDKNMDPEDLDTLNTLEEILLLVNVEHIESNNLVNQSLVAEINREINIVKWHIINRYETLSETKIDDSNEMIEYDLFDIDMDSKIFNIYDVDDMNNHNYDMGKLCGLQEALRLINKIK